MFTGACGGDREPPHNAVRLTGRPGPTRKETSMGDEHLPWGGDWCEGSPVETEDGERDGHCAACGRLVVPKKDGTARKHRPFR